MSINMSNMVLIPEGDYIVGNKEQMGISLDKEWDLTKVHLKAYYIDKTTVTNREFKEFIEASNYKTDAEKFGWSYVFYGLLDKHMDQDNILANREWWYAVKGASWQAPTGPGSSIEDKLDYPVVHVSRNDALAYAKWAHKRLPTELEWEVAAKGGTSNTVYPWGDARGAEKYKYANTWQGDFPNTNTKKDGYYGLAPAKAYPSNDYGIYQMIGNVWEWCLSRPDIDAKEQEDPQALMKKLADDESKLAEGDEYFYILRGGSFLCHKSYCQRDRIASRYHNTGNSSSSNMGFRCVKDA